MLGAEDADDATQDVFIRIWEKLPLYRPDAPFGSWLQRVALNVILRLLDAQKRPIRVASDVQVDELATRQSSPDARIDIDTALSKLHPGMREVVVLHDMEGYRHEEIAEQLEITVASSKMRLHRARLALRAFVR